MSASALSAAESPASQTCRMGGSWFVVFILAVASLHASPTLSFPVNETVIRLGQPCVLPIDLDRNADQDITWRARVDPPGLAEVTSPPQALAGRNLAFVDILPLREGSGTLHVENGPELRITVTPPVQTDRSLRWIHPAPHSVLHGIVSVGVEHPGSMGSPLEPEPNVSTAPQLIVPGLAPLEPIEIDRTSNLPATRYRFELDTGGLPHGLAHWQIRWRDATESHTPPLPLYILSTPSEPSAHPSDQSTTAMERKHYEAESLREALTTRQNNNKPYRLPEVGNDDQASSGAFAALNSNDQVLSVPVPVSGNEAWFQVMARVRGTAAGGSLPSIGVYLDQEDQPTATARVLSTNWHTILVGSPIRIHSGDTGAVIVSLRFLNDFASNKTDRNLHVDSFWLLPVPKEAQPNPLRVHLAVAMDQVFDGQSARGPFTVTGRAHYQGLKGQENCPPRVALRINGVPTPEQYSFRPRFHLSPRHLQAGRNTLQLIAWPPETTDNSTEPAAVSVIQSINLPETLVVGHPPTPTDHWFHPHDPAWTQTGGQSPQPDPLQKERRVLMLTNSDKANSVLELTIPASHPLRRHPCQVHVRVAAAKTKEPVLISVQWSKGGDFVPLADAEASSEIREIELGSVPAGNQVLRLSFRLADDRQPHEGRSVQIHHVRLSAERDRSDAVAPSVVWHYPNDGATLWREDAVVADVSDHSGIRSVRVLLDGDPLMPLFRPGREPGPLVIPLDLHNAAAGSRSLSLEVTDRAGNRHITEPRRVTVQDIDTRPPSLGPYHRAVHLLNRLSYGPEPTPLANILIHGESAWLKQALAAGPPPDSEWAAWERATLSINESSEYSVSKSAFAHAVLSPHPVAIRLNFWLQNHFSTWIRKTGSEAKWAEHHAFTRAGIIPFGDLLTLSATSPAMLVYLDQQRSFSKKINENYAREILELHTLSVRGRYNQEDVTALARMLTGWMTTEEAHHDGRGGRLREASFRFTAALNDPSPGQVFGLRVPEASSPEAALARIHRILAALARHPDTAQFIAKKLAEHYGPYPAPDALVNDLADTFHRTGGDLSAMIQTLVASPVFWEAADNPRMTSPLDHALRMARMIRDPDSHHFISFLSRANMGLFSRSTPDGYPDDPRSFADSNALLQRWHLARNIAWPHYQQLERRWKIPGNSINSEMITLATLTSLHFNGKVPDDTSVNALKDLLATKNPKELWKPSVGTLMLQLPQSQFR